MPTVDVNQDLSLIVAEEVNGITSISFTRNRSGTDAAPIDISLDKCVYLLWATGPQLSLDGDDANSIAYHGSSDENNRGISDQTICFPQAAQCLG